MAGGIIGILAAVNEEVEWSYWVNLAVIFSVTFLLWTTTFRSFLSAVALIIPLAISQILCEAFMLIKGIDLNINSLPVGGVIFWCFSSIKFQAEMGLLLAFLMVFNMIGAMVFLPVIVATIEPKRVLLKYWA